MAAAPYGPPPPPPRAPGLTIDKLTEEKCRFVLSATDLSVANALRRVMIAEVPTLAIDEVDVRRNDGAIPDEFVAHRLGLIPLRWRGNAQWQPAQGGPPRLPQDLYAFPYECSCEDGGGCERCSLRLELDVEYAVPEGAAAGSNPEMLRVTSRDLKIVGPPGVAALWEVAHFLSADEESKCRHDDGILITKLTEREALRVFCVARLGVGKVHAKWSPVATVALRQEPEIRLNLELLERVSVADKRAFERANPRGLFRFDEATGALICDEPRKATNIDEVRRLGAALARKYASADNVVWADYVRNKFIFVVESSGALDPELIVASALRVLTAKMHAVTTLAAALPGGARARAGGVM